MRCSRFTIREILQNRFSFSLPDFSPEPFYRFCARKLIHLLYRTDFKGFEKIPKKGGALIICNHISFVDGLILNAACHRKIRFIIDDFIYRQPVINYFMTMDEAIPIATNKASVQNALNLISEGLAKGDIICIFPEGQVTFNGYMSHFRPGIEWIIKRNPVPIYPVALHGLWGSLFSRKHRTLWKKLMPTTFRRKVSSIVGEVIQPENATVDYLQLVVLNLRTTLEQAENSGLKLSELENKKES